MDRYLTEIIVPVNTVYMCMVYLCHICMSDSINSLR